MKLATLLLLILAQNDPVTVSLSTDKDSYAPGDKGAVTVTFDIEKPYHIYSPGETTGVPTKVAPKPVRGIEWGAPQYPGWVELDQGGLKQKILEGYHIEVRVPFTVSKDAPGPAEAAFLVDYMACTDETCLPPKRGVEVKTVIPVAGEAPVAAAAERDATAETAERVLGGGFLAFLLAAIGGGLITLLMPCVFPLIPITLSYFAKQGEKENVNGALLSVTYAAGIVVTFTGVGLLMTLLLGSDGARRFAANPWVNLAIAALFLAFALSMFGVFRLALPASLTSKLSGKQRKGYGGAFVLGCIFSLVAFTCVVPIAASILALAAQGEGVWSLIGMLAYSGTMALPFLLLGFFPGFVRRLPRGGGWMQTTEHTVGFVEIGLALFYLSKADQTLAIGALGRTTMIVIYLLVSVAVAVYLLGGLLRGGARGPWPLAGRAGFGLAFLALGAFFAWGLAGGALGWANTILPPPPPEHHESFQAAWEEAKKEGKPLFLEFTGIT